MLFEMMHKVGKMPLIENENQSKTYSIYELGLGQPSRFYNSDSKSMTTDVNKATLYNKEDAEHIKNVMLKDRANKYNETGIKYPELHVGDLFDKGMRKY